MPALIPRLRQRMEAPDNQEHDTTAVIPDNSLRPPSMRKLNYLKNRRTEPDHFRHRCKNHRFYARAENTGLTHHFEILDRIGTVKNDRRHGRDFRACRRGDDSGARCGGRKAPIGRLGTRHMIDQKASAASNLRLRRGPQPDAELIAYVTPI